MISSYLSGRSQKTVLNNISSDTLQVTTGVPQGSILGPLLFSIFINDVEEVISNSSFHIYADDLQLYHSGLVSSPKKCLDSINEDLQRVWDWSIQNDLMLNISKTQSIIFYKYTINTENLIPIMLNNILIPYNKVVRNLGLYMDCTLSFNDNINHICSKVFYTLKSLWSVSSFGTPLFKTRLFYSYILPHFIYCDTVFYKLSEGNLYKLQMCLNACTRYVYNLKKFDHLSIHRNQLLGCDLKTFFDFRVILLYKKIFKYHKPEYLVNKIQMFVSTRSQRSLNRINLPLNSCSPLNHSFFVYGAKLWNSVPDVLKNASVNDVGRLKQEFIAWKNSSNFI